MRFSRIDYITLILFILGLLLNISCLAEFFSVDHSNLFYAYRSNSVLRLIAMLSIAINTIIIGLLITACLKRIFNRLSLIILTVGCGWLIASEWFWMWYSSTFYYGEVRDKQGWWFPITSLLISYYLIYRLPFSQKQGIKWIATAVTTLLFIIIFEWVKEPWLLYSS